MKMQALSEDTIKYHDPQNTQPRLILEVAKFYFPHISEILPVT